MLFFNAKACTPALSTLLIVNDDKEWRHQSVIYERTRSIITIAFWYVVFFPCLKTGSRRKLGCTLCLIFAVISFLKGLQITSTYCCPNHSEFYFLTLNLVQVLQYISLSRRKLFWILHNSNLRFSVHAQFARLLEF